MSAARHLEAWVDTIHPDDATGALATAYGWQAAVLGAPAEYTQLGSLHPSLVEERLRLYKVIDAVASGLTAEEDAFVVYLTSRLNDTVHCASGARAKLRSLGVGDELVARVDADLRHPVTGIARLDEVLRYTVLLTLTPGQIVEDDLDRLRDAGLNDADIVALNNLSAYYAYTNRVAVGLGLRTTIDPADALRSVPESVEP